jgi:Tol biopolymer transport system component
VNVINTILIPVLFIINISCNLVSSSLQEPENIITHWQSSPEFSRDGEKIVFQGLYDSITAVHFVDKNGNYLGRVLEWRPFVDTWFTNSPTWSPDGNRIALSISGSIHTIKTNGDSLTRLTFSDQDFDCKWSPSGKYIYYTKTICDPKCGLSIYDFSKKKGEVIRQYGGQGKWNKNSEKVYFRVKIYEKIPDSDKTNYKGFVLKRIDINSKFEDSLFFFKTRTAMIQSLAVSPDEKEILFSVVDGNPPQLNILKLNLESKAVERLTYDGGDQPSYSPDGQTIVYVNTKKGDGGLWLMNRDGSNKRKLTQKNREI